MKQRRYLWLLMAVAYWISAFGAMDAVSEIKECPEKAGGIYYSYNVEIDSVAPVPDGYAPVYVSHYGRHGSRWPVKQKIYSVASDFFQQQQLAQNITPDGKDIWKLVSLCAGNAAGHLGELTPRGAAQHNAIAGRMVRRFPELFADGAKVVARSSVEPRCIMSMVAFCDRLKELAPGLKISKYATPGDMDFIHHSTTEVQAVTGEEAPWMWEFHDYRDSVSQCPDVAAKLFKEVPKSDSLAMFMRSLYDIAISVQDIDGLDADLISVFDPASLAALWKASNYMQYVGNAKSPVSGNAGPDCAKTLLAEIVERADEMLGSGDVKVDLRFGHDTDLLRLVSLIDADGYGVELEDPDEAAEKWRNYDISPMAANFQMNFFRNDKGNVIVIPRLNEHPVTISDVPQAFPGYYDWELLKIYFNSL